MAPENERSGRTKTPSFKASILGGRWRTSKRSPNQNLDGVSLIMSVALNNQNNSSKIQNDFMRALMECSSELQDQVLLLLKDVVCPDDVDPDDKEMAMFTIADILFPNPHKGLHGMDLQESEDEAAQRDSELSEIVRQMDAQEATFAHRLQAAMDEQGMTQCELASAVGLGQSAIANLLARNCRPQRRTVVKLANALSVSPDELWPNTKDA